MKYISDLFIRNSTPFTTVLSFLMLVFFMTVILPMESGKAEAVSAGAGIPDLSFSYSRADLTQTASLYGEFGRKEYIRARLRFDILWPIVYTLFLITVISRFLSSEMPRLSYANLLPLAALTADLIENVSVSMVMAMYPERSSLWEITAVVATPLKWVLVSFCVLLLVYGLIHRTVTGIRPTED